jgi:hypothetical protein
MYKTLPVHHGNAKIRERLSPDSLFESQLWSIKLAILLGILLHLCGATSRKYLQPWCFRFSATSWFTAFPPTTQLFHPKIARRCGRLEGISVLKVKIKVGGAGPHCSGERASVK